MAPYAGHILIVDDEPFIRQLLRRTVEREGFSVVEAVDGAAALDEMKQNSFDFVITDIQMPRMDGMQLLAEIKSEFPNTQVLMITAYAGKYSEEDIIAAGADYFITKPFKNLEIRGTLTALKQRRRTQQNRAANSRKK